MFFPSGSAPPSLHHSPSFSPSLSAVVQGRCLLCHFHHSRCLTEGRHSSEHGGSRGWFIESSTLSLKGSGREKTLAAFLGVCESCQQQGNKGRMWKRFQYCWSSVSYTKVNKTSFKNERLAHPLMCDAPLLIKNPSCFKLAGDPSWFMESTKCFPPTCLLFLFEKQHCIVGNRWRRLRCCALVEKDIKITGTFVG